MKPKIFGFKNVMERGLNKKNSHFLKNFRENNTEALEIRKASSSPRMTEQIQIL